MYQAARIVMQSRPTLMIPINNKITTVVTAVTTRRDSRHIVFFHKPSIVCIRYQTVNRLGVWGPEAGAA